MLSFLVLDGAGLDGNLKGEDGSASLSTVLGRVKQSEQRTGKWLAHLAISPLQHALQGQVGAIDGGRLPPYWQSEEKDDEPKGEHDVAASPDVGRGLGRGFFGRRSGSRS